MWLVLVAAPAPAGAATTVGSDLAVNPNIGKGGDATYLMTLVRSGSAGASISNVDGVIVKWRLRYLKNNGTKGTLALRTGSRDGAKFRGGARSAPVDPPAATDGSATFVTTDFFPTRMPIFQGNFLGVDVGPEPVQRVIFYNVGGSGASVSDFIPPLAEGGDSRNQSFTSPDTELLVQAVVEPDGDADGFGDETQDNCPSLPNDQRTNPCPSTAVNTGGDEGDVGDDRPRGFRRHKKKRHHRPKRHGKRSSADRFRHHRR